MDINLPATDSNGVSVPTTGSQTLYYQDPVGGWLYTVAITVSVQQQSLVDAQTALTNAQATLAAAQAQVDALSAPIAALQTAVAAIPLAPVLNTAAPAQSD
jgi:hypothetical protein